MPSVSDLRDRIRSLKNTQQITKAMKQVAAAKIRRAEAAQKRARPYAEALAEMLGDLIAAVSSVDHPFMKAGNASAPPGIVLIGSDKGLAGAFNSNVVRAAEEFARGRGERAILHRRLQGAQCGAAFGGERYSGMAAGKRREARTAREVAARTAEDFTNGAISEIVLVSQKLVSMMVQRPQARKLVPVLADDSKILPERQMPRNLPGRRAVPSSFRRARSSCCRGCFRSISSSRSIRRCSRPMRRSLPRSSSP